MYEPAARAFRICRGLWATELQTRRNPDTWVPTHSLSSGSSGRRTPRVRVEWWVGDGLGR